MAKEYIYERYIGTQRDEVRVPAELASKVHTQLLQKKGMKFMGTSEGGNDAPPKYTGRVRSLIDKATGAKIPTSWRRN